MIQDLGEHLRQVQAVEQLEVEVEEVEVPVVENIDEALQLIAIWWQLMPGTARVEHEVHHHGPGDQD